MWEQIITNKNKIEATYLKLDLIASELENIPKSNNNLSLFGGLGGVILFFSELTKLPYYEKKKSYLFYLLDKIINDLENDENINYSLSNGVAGICWLFDHLIKNKTIEVDSKKFFSKDIEVYLSQCALNDLKENRYDYLHNGLGVFLYFSNKSRSNLAKYFFDQAIEHIEKSSIVEENRLGWLSENFLSKEEFFNFGLAHGIPSIISILTRIYKQKKNRNKISLLINKSINFILNYRNSPDELSIFPYAIGETNHIKSSRLAWCYGDLGIASTLWNYGKITNNSKWKKEAVNIMLHSSKRRDLNSNMVLDAGICHGTSGIAHIFNRFYQETQIEKLKETSLYWYDETFKMSKFENGLAGFKTWQTEEFGGWKNDYSFLEGVTGIGLSLVSSVSNSEPKWDQALLLSI